MEETILGLGESLDLERVGESPDAKLWRVCIDRWGSRT
jgi:hypothetical protein